MSNTPLKCIMLIIKRIHFGDLLDCPLFATKTPFHPKSSRCPFSEYLYTKHFPMHALLDPSRRLHPPGENEPPQGKVHRLRGKCTASGENEPFSPKFPALSPHPIHPP